MPLDEEQASHHEGHEEHEGKGVDSILRGEMLLHFRRKPCHEPSRALIYADREGER